MPNRVVAQVNSETAGIAGETFTNDPTAHGERQLVYWYLANRDNLGLPDAADLTVVTSLDPCVMCTGALLTAGLNAATVGRDTFSGINFNNTGSFASLPSGPVRNTRKNTGTDPSQLRDPASDSGAAAVIEAYQKVYPDAFAVRIANFRSPDQRVRAVLEDLVAGTPGATNAVAFIDPFGNLVLASADSSDNPAAPAFMPVAQDYSTTRFALNNDPSTVQIAQQTLTSPKFGTFVFLRAPSPNSTTTVETLGAYGSTVESALPQTNPSNFQYFDPPLVGDAAALTAEIAVLPPLYSSLVQIGPRTSLHLAPRPAMIKR